MPESVGSGGALADFDNDGLLDLFLVNSGRSPQAEGDFAEEVRATSRLFRMLPEHTWQDVSTESGLENVGYGMGCVTGDVDNDGDLDLYVTTVGRDRLYLNQGGLKFLDVSDSAGFSASEWSTGAAFIDYDRDGLLDLFVVNYCEDPQYQFSVACGFREGLVSYCGPHKFERTIDRLYHNDGLQIDSVSGMQVPRFTDVTEAAGIGTEPTYGFTVCAGDFTGDHWPDFFVANDSYPNVLWVNQKDGTFRDESVERAVAYNGDGASQGSMGIAIGDLDGERGLDFVVSNLSGESNTIYLNNGDGYFDDKTYAMGLERPSRRHTGWGISLIDLDHDGNLDLPMVNGLVIPCHSGFAPHGDDTFQVRRDHIANPETYWEDYYDRNRLMLSAGKLVLTDGTVDVGGDFTRAAGSGRALIRGDVDNDGDVDLLVTNSGSRARLYRNDFTKSGHWLKLRLFDDAKNRDALGAEVRVESSTRSWTSVLSPADSYLASHELRVHFGLGNVDQIDRIVVLWPDGPVENCAESFLAEAVDLELTLRRGSGTRLENDK